MGSGGASHTRADNGYFSHSSSRRTIVLFGLSNKIQGVKLSRASPKRRAQSIYSQVKL
jgi:hypothetical protein